MWDPLRLFPQSWKTPVEVTRGGGRDRFNNVLPEQKFTVEECLLAPRATVDPVDLSDVVTSTGVLYHRDFRFLPKDRLKVPDGARMSGDWAVDGAPNEWPFGVEVKLVRN